MKQHNKAVLPLVNKKVNRYDIITNIQKLDTSYTNNLYPTYICNLTKVIQSFPKPQHSFYVYRGVYLSYTHSVGDWVSQPIPFSSSMNQWLAISFPELRNNECCLYKIKITPEMNCVMLGDTPYQSSQHLKDKKWNKFTFDLWNTTKKPSDLSKYNQFEVLLPPGILKVTKVRRNMYIPTNTIQNKYRNNNDSNTSSIYRFPTKGVTLIDVDYEPIQPISITPEDLLLVRNTI